MKPATFFSPATAAYVSFKPPDHAQERRELAIAREVLALRTERRISAGVVVAPEERAGLLVEATTHGDAEASSRDILDSSSPSPLCDVPGVAVGADAEANGGLEAARYQFARKRDGLARAISRW